MTHVRQRLVSLVIQRLHVVITCGLTPGKMALTLCLGAAIGILPLVWGTSLICVVLAYLFRLNHVALQSVNYLFYPLQLALLLPFFKLGERLFSWGPQVPPDIYSTLIHDPGSSLRILCWVTLKSIAAWGVSALPAALIVYGVLRITVFANNRETSGEPEDVT